jgi:threonine dehydrogenase-like Zn-dependent dehydrogenase
MAFRSVRPGGTVSIVGVFTEDVALPMAMFSIAGVTVRSGLGRPEVLPRLMAMVESGALDLKSLFSHTLPLSEGPRAYRLFDRKEEGAQKMLLKP